MKSMTSYASLTSLVRSMGSDEVDPLEIASDWTARLKRVLEHGVAVRSQNEYPRAIFYDMHFSDFVLDQLAVVRKIYEAFDLPMTTIAAERMQAFIADNPKGKHGIHRYAPAEYGVEPAAVRRAFRAYMDRFDLAPEAD